jgi:hypothetical protein
LFATAPPPNGLLPLSRRVDSPHAVSCRARCRFRIATRTSCATARE